MHLHDRPSNKLFFQVKKSGKMVAASGALSLYYTFFLYKKLGLGHRTKSFLISHEILSILVLKVS